MMSTLKFTNKAKRDIDLIHGDSLKSNLRAILDLLKVNPYQSPPPFEKLRFDLAGNFSRRINRQHRVVYGIFPKTMEVIIFGLHGHY